jgi:glycosyltransferase involved in cell wall biosynthesis
MSRNDVTIALFTCHRPWMLGEALASIDRLIADEFTLEILVVDNASQESTRRLVTEFARTSKHPVRLVCEEKPGLSCARNRAIREAHSEWIAFFDDDQLAEPEWLQEMVHLARAERCLVVGGTLRLKLPSDCSRHFGPVCRKLLGEFVGGAIPRRYTRTFTPGFGHILVHLSVFDQVGDFDERLVAGGEDFDVYNRIRKAGIVTWYCPAAVAYHVIPSYRIEDRYIRWTALRKGGHVAHRERQGRGSTSYFGYVTARLGQAMLLHAPRYFWHRLRHDDELALDARCRLWRSEGYLRQALFDLMPRLFGQREFFASLNFREGRQRLADSNR